MNTADAQKKAFDYALELTKLLITLSTGIIALSITFFSGFAQQAPDAAKNLMTVSWLLYLFSVPFGLVTLMALVSELDSTTGSSITARRVTIPAMLQVLLFFLALALTAVAGIQALP